MLKGFNFNGLAIDTLADLLDAIAYLVGLVDEGRYARRFPEAWHDAMQGMAYELSMQIELYQTNNPDEFELDPDADLAETQEFDATDWQPDPLPEPVEVSDEALSAFTAFFETWADDDEDTAVAS